MDISEKLDQQINDLVDKLKDKDPDSDEYKLLIERIKELWKIKMENDKMVFEYDRDFANRKDKEKELKVEKFKGVSGLIGSILAFVGGLAALRANTKWINNIMNFEQTGTIRSKGFNFIGKIPFIKR